MKYFSRGEVESIGYAGAYYDGEKARFLSSFWLYLEENDTAFTPHWREGMWEAWVTYWISNQFDKHDTFFDIGANVGYYSAMAATHGVPHVIAVEPQPDLCKLLYKTFKENRFKIAGFDNFPQVTISSTALGSADKDYEMRFYVPEGHSGAGFLSNKEFDYPYTNVYVYDFDLAFNAFSHPYNKVRGRILLKIDAEGSEPDIWAGMKKFRACNDWTIALEWAPARYEDAGAFADELLQHEVRLINYDGLEEPISKEALLAIEEFQMIVVRNWH